MKKLKIILISIGIGLVLVFTVIITIVLGPKSSLIKKLHRFIASKQDQIEKNKVLIEKHNVAIDLAKQNNKKLKKEIKEEYEKKKIEIANSSIDDDVKYFNDFLSSKNQER